MSGMMNLTHSTQAFHTFPTILLNLLTAAVIVFWKLQPKQMRFPTSASSLHNQPPMTMLRSISGPKLYFCLSFGRLTRLCMVIHTKYGPYKCMVHVLS